MEKKKTKELIKPEPAEKETFEASVKKLEEIAYRLEKGEPGLDESIELFEAGIKLSKRCHDLLEAAERRIEILQKGDNGTVEPRRVRTKGDTGEIEDEGEMQGSLL